MSASTPSRGPLAPGETRALQDRVRELSAAGDATRALRSSVELMERLGFPLAPGLRAGVAEALAGRLDRVEAPSGSLDEPGSRAAVIAEGYIVQSLDQLGRYELALAVVDDLVARFGESSHQPTRDAVANALLLKLPLLNRLDRSDEALALCEDAIKRLGDATDDNSRRLVGWVLTAKARLLEKRGEPRDAVAVREQLIRRRDELIDRKLAPNVANSLMVVARYRLESGDAAHAMALCEELLERFGEADHPRLSKYADAARELQAGLAAEGSGSGGGAARTARPSAVLRYGQTLTIEADIRHRRYVLLDRSGEPVAFLPAGIDGQAMARERTWRLVAERRHGARAIIARDPSSGDELGGAADGWRMLTHRIWDGSGHSYKLRQRATDPLRWTLAHRSHSLATFELAAGFRDRSRFYDTDAGQSFGMVTLAQQELTALPDLDLPIVLALALVKADFSAGGGSGVVN